MSVHLAEALVDGEVLREEFQRQTPDRTALQHATIRRGTAECIFVYSRALIENIAGCHIRAAYSQPKDEVRSLSTECWRPRGCHTSPGALFAQSFDLLGTLVHVCISC